MSTDDVSDIDYLDDLTPKELEEIFENRDGSMHNEWKIIKENFYDIGLENILLEEQIDNFTFHILYNKITSFTDEEIFDHLIQEL